MESGVNGMIESTSQNWADQWMAARIANLSKRGVRASGDLNRSFGNVVAKGSGNVAVRVEVGFAEHGRYIDMKRYSHDKWGRNALERVTAWISQKGIQKFEAGFLKKYKLQAAPKDMLNRMAWGIMVNRSNNKFRRKAWYAKAQGGGVNDLLNQVVAGLPGEVINDFKKGFNQ